MNEKIICAQFFVSFIENGVIIEVVVEGGIKDVSSFRNYCGKSVKV